MKKIIAILTISMVLTCLVLPALADESFEFWAQCTTASSTNLQTDWSANYEYKNTANNSLYVKHWVYGGSNDYTNYFRAFRDDSIGTYRGAKWATVNLKVPIESTSIIPNYYYGVAGRGNTNHYDYDGNAQVSLHGYYYDK